MLNKEEFKLLFDKYFNDLRRYVFYRSGNDELATDIAQETFLKYGKSETLSILKQLKDFYLKLPTTYLFLNTEKKK
jgi:DNA-directed RNA polymerase specialized sigma24 family protein